MKLDLKRVELKLQFVRDNLAFLRELSAMSAPAFVADQRSFYAAVHALQISIEAMLDVFTHTVARLHLGTPTNDRETLEALLRARQIPEEHFNRFADMVKFRNKAVHGYIDVDAKKVYEKLQTELEDFDLFFADVKAIIESERAKDRDPNQKS